MPFNIVRTLYVTSYWQSMDHVTTKAASISRVELILAPPWLLYSWPFHRSSIWIITTSKIQNQAFITSSTNLKPTHTSVPYTVPYKVQEGLGKFHWLQTAYVLSQLYLKLETDELRSLHPRVRELVLRSINQPIAIDQTVFNCPSGSQPFRNSHFIVIREILHLLTLLIIINGE